MRGGIRLGAGRPSWKAKTSQYRSIDVRRFERDNLLRAGQPFGWKWWDDAGNVQSSIAVRAHDGGLTVSYQINGEGVEQRIATTTTPCTYGGGRTWFVCPYCLKRRALLYVGRQVACRTCFRLTYPSQCEDAVGRLWRKQQKIEARLQSGKRMQERTRERLVGELERIEEAKDAVLFEQMTRLLGDAGASRFW